MTWEYFTLMLPEGDNDVTIYSLNEMGMNAWELVSVNTLTPVGKGLLKTLNLVQYTFKREKVWT